MSEANRAWVAEASMDGLLKTVSFQSGIFAALGLDETRVPGQTLVYQMGPDDARRVLEAVLHPGIQRHYGHGRV